MRKCGFWKAAAGVAAFALVLGFSQPAYAASGPFESWGDQPGLVDEYYSSTNTRWNIRQVANTNHSITDDVSGVSTSGAFANPKNAELQPTTAYAKNYVAIPGSEVVGSWEALGMSNFLVYPVIPSEVYGWSGFSLYKGKTVVLYDEKADGTTQQVRVPIPADAGDNWYTVFMLDEPVTRFTITIEPINDLDANTTPHFDDIMWLLANGISTGFPDGTYRVLDKVARCDMAAFLRRQAQVMGVEGADTWKPSEKDWAKFSDIKKDTPHAEDVLWLASTGISTGFADGTFKPYDKVARCDMAAFLYRLHSLKITGSVSGDLPGIGDASFKDVDSSTPHAQEVLWLASTGVSKGFPDGTFKSYDKVARCDMAAFLHRLNDLTK